MSRNAMNWLSRKTTAAGVVPAMIEQKTHGTR
jgi:hypothetical protein